MSCTQPVNVDCHDRWGIDSLWESTHQEFIVNEMYNNVCTIILRIEIRLLNVEMHKHIQTTQTYCRVLRKNKQME